MWLYRLINFMALTLIGRVAVFCTGIILPIAAKPRHRDKVLEVPLFKELLTMKCRLAFAFVWAFLPWAHLAVAEECTHLWKTSLEIAPDAPKGMSGDTYAAYGLIGFYAESNLRLEIRGEYPRGRFMSFQSYRTSRKRTVHHLFDSDIKPDQGSTNPFVPGNDVNAAQRFFSVDAVTNPKAGVSQNILLLDPNTNIHSIFYRYYVPVDGYTPSENDLPRIFAVDAKTNAPRSCPKYVDTQLDPGPVAHAILRLVKKKTVLDFEPNADFDNGVNAAVPGYVTVLSRIDHGSVSLIRFKPPTHPDTQTGSGPFPPLGEVRYWSMCMQNLHESETLVCLPDYLAQIGSDGIVTIVVGKGQDVQDLAARLGHNFLEDRRKPEQIVTGYFYRNLLPTKGFVPYKGAYLPKGVVCSREAFLSGDCRIQ
jgi:hypothetical protein